MKKTFKFISIYLGVLTLFFSIKNSIVISSADNENYSEIVMDINTNRVLYEKNGKQKRLMASLTKIMTAIIVLENCDIEKVITVDKKTTNIEGSSIYLVEGEKLSIKELLYGLMLRSGNDCAETLAIVCSGSIENFASFMNKKAKEIGANNTNFVNPHGLHNDNHYTTAYDLALICCYAMKNPEFKKIVSTKKITISNTTKDYKRVLVNKNKLLFNNEYATGIKTGYTKKAGRCLASSFNKNGHEIVCVVLNVPPMFERSEEVSNNAFNNYKQIKVLESDNVLDFVTLKNSNKKCPVCIKKDVLIPFQKNEIKKLQYQIEYDKNLTVPLKKDKEIGKIKFFIENNLIFIEKIYTMVDIK